MASNSRCVQQTATRLPARSQSENGIVLGVGVGGRRGGGGLSYMIPVACSGAEERVKSCFLAALALSAVH